MNDQSDERRDDNSTYKRNQAPTISAVIPAYNAAGTIERALASVYAQTYDSIIEVIVVDDGSTDSTAAIVRDKFPKVKLVQQENSGEAGARNGGIKHATGDYIAFLDADDEWVPEKTRVQIDVLARHPGIDIVTCHFALQSADNRQETTIRKIAGDAFVNMTRFDDWLFWVDPTADYAMIPNSSGLLIDSSLFARIGPMDETLAGSVEFLIRATGLGYTVAVIGQPLSIIHAVEGSLSRSNTGQLAIAPLASNVIPRYDPSGSGWASGLLSETQFRKAMYAASVFGAKYACQAGDIELAAKYIGDALGQGHASGLRFCALKLVSMSPSASYRLALLYGRVRSSISRILRRA